MTSPDSGADRRLRSTDDLTISEADAVTGFERSTIKHGRDAGRYEHARKGVTVASGVSRLGFREGRPLRRLRQSA